MPLNFTKYRHIYATLVHQLKLVIFIFSLLCFVLCRTTCCVVQLVVSYNLPVQYNLLCRTTCCVVQLACAVQLVVSYNMLCRTTCLCGTTCSCIFCVLPFQLVLSVIDVVILVISLFLLTLDSRHLTVAVVY